MANALHGHRFDEQLNEDTQKLAQSSRLIQPQPAAHQRAPGHFAEHNVYLAEFLDDSVMGQAETLKGLPAEEVYRQLREEVFEAVALHEIGHTVGMTHNFEASFDALNYQDEFGKSELSSPEEVGAWSVARISLCINYGLRQSFQFGYERPREI